MAEKLKMTMTSRGLAAIWLRRHDPDAGAQQVESLTDMFDMVFEEGIKKGLEDAKNTVASSPTLSAAEATIEEDIGDIKRNSQDPPDDRKKPHTSVLDGKRWMDPDWEDEIPF